MEYLAKITYEEKQPNSKLYKYGFEDIQTKEEGYFYNRGRMECYISGLVFKLNLSLEDDQQTKTCQSFEPDLVNTVIILKHLIYHFDNLHDFLPKTHTHSLTHLSN